MKPEIFCALDTTDIEKAKTLAGSISSVCGLKLGLEFFNAHGPQGIRAVMESAPDGVLFLDLKFHDIPNTVAGAVRAVMPLAPHYFNVHASGGTEMMRAALDAAQGETARLGVSPPKLLAVTVLTSLGDSELEAVGQARPASDQVRRLADLAQRSGLDGVVCSAHEIVALRAACGPDFVLMVPGIRPVGADLGDQKRVMTPAAAMQAGASHLVIGRPVTGAADPAEAARGILRSIHEVSP
ncbi:MAG: orotidine-5'-phosphate decarboxylase [Rhodospirillales bacterium]|nr:orotidine-5'-phosphate decarboxylase [Rhodospirillales bacterium]